MKSWKLKLQNFSTNIGEVERKAELARGVYGGPSYACCVLKVAAGSLDSRCCWSLVIMNDVPP